MAAAIPFIGPAISIGSQLLGGSKQKQGSQQASAGQAQLGQQLSGFQGELRDQARGFLAEGAPVRDAANQAALGTFPLLEQSINRAPGTGVAFQHMLGQGAKNLFSSAAPFGLTDSQLHSGGIGGNER